MATPKGFLRVKEQLPFDAKGVDNVVLFVKKVLLDNKFAQKFTFEAGKPFFYLEKLVREEEATPEQRGIPLHELTRNRPMVEYLPEKKISVHHQMMEMFDLVAKQELWPLCMLAGDLKGLNKWLGLPLSRACVYGLPALEVGELPPDVFLICGGAGRDSSPDELEFSVLGRTL